jgi:hypothetical protein
MNHEVQYEQRGGDADHAAAESRQPVDTGGSGRRFLARGWETLRQSRTAMTLLAGRATGGDRPRGLLVLA